MTVHWGSCVLTEASFLVRFQEGKSGTSFSCWRRFVRKINRSADMALSADGMEEYTLGLLARGRRLGVRPVVDPPNGQMYAWQHQGSLAPPHEHGIARIQPLNERESRKPGACGHKRHNSRHDLIARLAGIPGLVRNFVCEAYCD